MNLVRYMNKPGKTEFDNFLVSIFPYKQSDLYEIMAVKLVYQNEIKEAFLMFQNCKGSGNREMYGDPFDTDIKDCYYCNINYNEVQPYNKINFVRKMILLEYYAGKDPAKAASNYFAIANGYYNITYFGKAREMYQTCIQGIHNIGFKWDEWTKSAENNDPILDCSLAEKYYLKAAELSNDKEFKAKCYFMAAKCEQNTFFVNELSEYNGDFKAGKYFNKLVTEYSNTDYFKDLVNECGYFAKYTSLFY